jgi:uncharacterized protein (TIGR00156 family)
MRKSLSTVLVVAVLMSVPAASRAQYVGPNSVPLTTVKQLLERGADDQRAIIRGRIISHDGDDNYTFEDETGSMRVEISRRHFPKNQPIDANRLVELQGELDKDFYRTEFDVDSLRLL